MAKKSSLDAFVYNWQIEESIVEGDMHNELYVYCITDSDKTLCVRFSDFNPTVYVELPSNQVEKNPGKKEDDESMLRGKEIKWDAAKAQLVVNYLNYRLCPHGEEVKKNQIVSWSLEHMHRLYYAHMNEDGSKKVFPYLRLSFKSVKTAKKISYMCQAYQSKQKQVLNISGIGSITMKVHECEANSVLQFTQKQNIPTCGWVTLSGLIEPELKETSCDYEYE